MATILVVEDYCTTVVQNHKLPISMGEPNVDPWPSMPLDTTVVRPAELQPVAPTGCLRTRQYQQQSNRDFSVHYLDVTSGPPHPTGLEIYWHHSVSKNQHIIIK